MMMSNGVESGIPVKGYCAQRARGRLIQLVWAALFLLASAGGAAFFAVRLAEDKTGWEYMEYIKMIAGAVIAVGGLILALYEAYTGLRDALCPEKSALASSIRDQLPYPEEAPPVEELFAMVDEDIRNHGRWFGNLAVGGEWVLGDVASYIPHIRGIFGRDETHTSHGGGRTRTTRFLEIWLMDNHQRRQTTVMKSPQELQAALSYLHALAPAAVFGRYNSGEYNAYAYAKPEEWQALEEKYELRKAQLEERARREQERQAQNQVLTFPDGSVTSRITGDSLSELLFRCRREGETRHFQLVPGYPIPGERRAFSRLVCFPGREREPVRLFVEEFSGQPGRPGERGWMTDVEPEEAEAVLGRWLRGVAPSLKGWTPVTRTDHGWQE